MKEIKVKCKHDFQVWDMLENVLEGEFIKDEIYIAELDEETQEYHIKGETDLPVAHYDINDELIMDCEFELVK